MSREADDPAYLPTQEELERDLEETVARLIDPSRWRVLDSYLADVKRKYKGQNAGYDLEAFRDKASLSTARTIISIIRGPA